MNDDIAIFLIIWALIGIAAHCYFYGKTNAFNSLTGSLLFLLILPHACLFGPFMWLIEGICYYLIEYRS